MLWCGEHNIPFSIVYTKSDKNSKSQLTNNISAIEKELLKHWEELPNTFISSAEKKAGKEEVLEFIQFQIKQSNKPGTSDGE